MSPPRRWADGIPDPLSLAWPRRTARLVLRPIDSGDVDAMLAYRSDPAVTEFLTHDPLMREEVEERIAMRISGIDPTPPRLVRGLMILHEGRGIGDAMLRVQPSTVDGSPQLWIGCALAREFWGRGFATEVARVLVEVGAELGLPVWADVVADNVASQRVLVKAGLWHVHDIEEDERLLAVHSNARVLTSTAQP